MRLDGVEIEVSIAGTEVPSALDALGIGDDGQRRGIGFIEDSTVGVELPLFHHGVVLRVREIDDDEDDSTVKLRPCRRSQVTEQWLDEGPDGRTVKIERIGPAVVGCWPSRAFPRFHPGESNPRGPDPERCAASSTKTRSGSSRTAQECPSTSRR